MFDFIMRCFLVFMFLGIPFIMILHNDCGPLWKKKCNHCGARDKKWNVVPVGHDDFAWQHNCEIEK